jgi:hypothetical protein
VLIEDARRDGHHLRVTWHPEHRQFVLSTWREDVCTGAARLAVEDAAGLAALLVDGLADAAAAAAAAPPSRPGLRGLVGRIRWLWFGAPAAPPRPPGRRAGGARAADVRPLRRGTG